MMDRNEAERILAALKSGTPHIDRHKAAEALEWALRGAAGNHAPDDGTIILDRWVSGTVMSARGESDE